jgi:hypothetical protein
MYNLRIDCLDGVEARKMENAKVKPFDFLTEARARMFRLAIAATNTKWQQQLAETQHIVARMSPLNKSNNRRGWLLGYMGDYFSDDVARLRYDFNMGAIAFENHFVRFVKFDNVNVENPPDEPRPIKEARFKATSIAEQLSMFEEDEVEKASPDKIPLYELYPIVAGYLTNDIGLIIGLDFADQQGEEIREIYSLDLSIENSVDNMVVLPQAISKPSVAGFRLKSEFQQKSDAAEEDKA